ncbi:MAG TPA: type II toxin-antitoxin system PemK/MazF family toxin [Solirubrobacterales bacterium]|nr:type II toxin-antitoxin system PemK/MazF family toxin [Solirubrobacterales bacterium]
MVRGDVCAVKLPKGRGRVQHGPRYAVVVQADAVLNLSTVVICPTSTSIQPARIHPGIVIGDEPTRVMCEMVGSVDGRAIGDRVAHLSIDELDAVDEGLELVLDLG